MGEWGVRNGVSGKWGEIIMGECKWKENRQEMGCWVWVKEMGIGRKFVNGE